VRFELGPHDVHVRYRFTDRITQEEYTQALQTLASDERERAARFVLPRDRFGFVAAHSLLRQALSDHENVPLGAWMFAENAYGKPALAGRFVATNLRFNLTHTHGLVACAVCRGADVGIDAESLAPRFHPLDLANRFFSPSEVIGLQKCAESERYTRFIELWTLKEAYVKAIGLGLSHPLQSFSFVLDGASSLRFESATSDDLAGWHFALLAPSTRHRMAVATWGSARETLQMRAWADEPDNTAPAVLRVSGKGNSEDAKDSVRLLFSPPRNNLPV
jgi:4'-phosphopantetheinyl transferase